MNSVFSAFKSNKSNNSSTLNASTSSENNNSAKKNQNSSKKTLKLNETNDYEKLRHIREKMSNLMIDDDEINLRKPTIPPIAPIEDVCDSMLPPKKPTTTSAMSLKMNGFDCVDSAPLMNGKLNGNNYANNNIGSLSSIKKHYNQDNSENYASENNLLSKCCNGGTAAMGSDVSIADTNDVVNNSSASASSLISVKSMPLSNSNELACRSALTVYNKQPQPTNFSNSNRNRPRLSLSSISNNSSSCNNVTTTTANCQPAVHGRNTSNGLPTGQTRTRLSTHQRNLSLDFR